MTTESVTAIADNTYDDPTGRSPLVLGDRDLMGITDGICQVVEQKPPKVWYAALAISGTILGILGLMIAYLFIVGTGTWGLNSPAFWGWAIVNFVFGWGSAPGSRRTTPGRRGSPGTCPRR